MRIFNLRKIEINDTKRAQVVIKTFYMQYETLIFPPFFLFFSFLLNSHKRKLIFFRGGRFERERRVALINTKYTYTRTMILKNLVLLIICAILNISYLLFFIKLVPRRASQFVRFFSNISISLIETMRHTSHCLLHSDPYL